jgi:hypothetical protein
MDTSWTPWHEVVEVRDDLKSGVLSLDLFAADLYDVLMQEGERPVYEDPEEFFKLTYPTHSLRELSREVAERLSGSSTKAVRQLELTYEGGKTHSLITLHHLFSDPEGLPDLPSVSEFKSHIGRDLPDAQVGAIPFDYLDSKTGIEVYSPRGDVRTLKHPWSVLAFQIAGEEGLKILNDGSTEERDDPPVTGPLKTVFQYPTERGRSVLILLDEVLMYVQNRVGANPSSEKPLINFFQCLTQAVSKVDRCCLIASILASDLSVYNKMGKQLERDVAKIFGRKEDESVRPVDKKDIAEVLRRRFFTLDTIRDRDSFRSHVTAALQGIKTLDEETKKRGKKAEERYLQSYPFHPDLTTIFYEKWTNLESFQEARGVLRVMALAVRDSAAWDESPLISTNVFLSEPGRAELSAAASELADIAAKEEYEGTRQNWSGILEGELGRMREIQDHYTSLNGREIEQLLFAIFLHSQPKGHKAQLIDLIRLIGHTRPDQIELEQALKDVTSTSWFLDEEFFPPKRDKLPKEWRLGSRPNLTQMHHEARSRIENHVEPTLVDAITGAKSLTKGARGAGAVVHNLPTKPGDVKDDGRFHYAVLGPDAASYPGDPSERAERFLFETTAKDRPRVNKNAIVLAVPSPEMLETARNRVRDHLAWKEVKDMLNEEDANDLRDQRVQRNIRDSESKIDDAVRQAYCVVVTVGRDGDAEAFKVPAGESSLFAQIKNHDKARIKDSAITPETILPGGPYDLWREDEASRRVSHITEAFAQQPELPKMLRPEGIYDTIALGCEEGTFVLRLPRPDGSVRTEWRTRPDGEHLREPSLEAVLPEHAELANLDPVLLTPGELPKLWEDEEPLSVGDLYDYFSGDYVAQVEQNGYPEPVPIPKATPDVLKDAIRTAVQQGNLWLRKGQTSLYDEEVPEGLIDEDTILKTPPESISPTDLLPKKLPDAWPDGETTASDLASALSDEYGEPLPWPIVRKAIDGAFRANYMKPSVDSKEWPTDRSGAGHVKIELPSVEETPSDDKWTSKETPPAGGFGSGVKRASGELGVDEIQNLADEIGELVSAAAGHGIQFNVTIEAGTDESLPDEVEARLNEILKRVSESLQI